MSREGAGHGSTHERSRAAGTPIWVGVLYFFGAVGAIMLAFLVSLKLAEELFWDDAPSYDASVPLVVLWTALVVTSLVVWARRRR